MSLNVRTILIWVLSIGIPAYIHACNCEVRNSFNIRDWNDTPIIFKAILNDYVRTNQFVKLSFNQINTIKGVVKDEITIYVKTNESHTLVHGISQYQSGDTWLVFAEKEIIGNKKYIRLLDSEDSAFCALSKPISSGDDLLLNYIESVANASINLVKEESDNLLSIGKLKHGLPHGKWKYKYPSGTICLMEYKRGVKSGLEQYFNADLNGQYQKTKEVFYVDNRKQYLKTYHTDGILSEWIVYGKEENFLLRFRSKHLIGKWVYNKLTGKTTAYLKKKKGVEIFEVDKPIKELR